MFMRLRLGTATQTGLMSCSFIVDSCLLKLRINKSLKHNMTPHSLSQLGNYLKFSAQINCINEIIIIPHDIGLASM